MDDCSLLSENSQSGGRVETRFPSFLLPRQVRDQPEGRISMADRSSKVLLVEDDGMVCLFLEDFLADLGCAVVGPAATAAEAEFLAADQAIDFAILDVSLIGGTSFRTAEILRERRLPFMFLTAYGVDGIREDLRRSPWMGKPIKVADLETFLRQTGVV